MQDPRFEYRAQQAFLNRHYKRLSKDDAMKMLDGYLKLSKLDDTVSCATCSKHDRIAYHGEAGVPVCDTCASGALRRCSRCQNVSYCCKVCQKIHWKDHKAWCTRVVECRSEKKAMLGESSDYMVQLKQWYDEPFTRSLNYVVEKLAADPFVNRYVLPPSANSIFLAIIGDDLTTGSSQKFALNSLKCLEPEHINQFLSEYEAASLAWCDSPSRSTSWRKVFATLVRESIVKQKLRLAQLAAEPGRVAVVSVYHHMLMGPTVYVKGVERELLDKLIRRG
ncbi:hypothetical protein BV25DRAFT_1916499 [Artomyces pyxidatus]|uniref:Uncharacterized protein n=1 Tax=Artomyces pyxidatus TaxID=48021 RepID=A0ACB8T016_9AGAM|nr:hypothetical protein BV25DRAFT_1916499 [Artomyces pyxidatus]